MSKDAGVAVTRADEIDDGVWFIPYYSFYAMFMVENGMPVRRCGHHHHFDYAAAACGRKLGDPWVMMKVELTEQVSRAVPFKYKDASVVVGEEEDAGRGGDA